MTLLKSDRKDLPVPSLSSVPRREFLKLASAAAVATAADHASAAPLGKVQIVTDPADAVASSAPAAWAVKQFRRALSAKGIDSELAASPGAGNRLVVVVSSRASGVKGFSAGRPMQEMEGVRLAPGRVEGAGAILVSSPGARGLVYGLLELADRVDTSADSSFGLHLAEPLEETPANPTRSVARAFCSEVEDKVWFYDKNFWRGYLDMLAASRFNRFNFAFGFGYDFPRGVTDDYFQYPYPYLLDVPGYDVRVVPLTNAERARNLETLQFIAAETAARGLEFQVGIWTHAYQWTDSPHAYHRIEGLTPETHAAYSRDALALLLKSCPQIQGLTLRVHGESGIPEGSYGFWQTLFEAIAGCGRKVEIDMHAKGINQIMIDLATKTGMPVKVGAKYAAEHMGLGYQQADIRALEIPRPGRTVSGPFSVSSGARSFTRYGYADLFQEGRKFDVWFRLWPGTQRHLLWADPETAAAYGRTAHFCNASGLEICEPLTFKGREGTGVSGGRCAYSDKTLEPGVNDWRKFEYGYRVWGRLLYRPDSNAEVWQRALRKRFGNGAAAAGEALANAGRVLPLVTTAHLPSASNHSFWPEIYANMPIVLGSERSPYSDTPTPRCFGTVSPLDPQLFSSIVEYADGILSGQPNLKYSPVEVAQWLEDFTAASRAALKSARSEAKSIIGPEFRRWEEDTRIQIGLGEFFAAKLRSGVLFEIYQKAGSPDAGRLALVKYSEARQAWASMARRAGSVYRSDITYGSIPQRRGDWAARLTEIDIDIDAMRAALRSQPFQPAGGSASSTEKESMEVANRHSAEAIRLASGKPMRPNPDCHHDSPEEFSPGKPLGLELRVERTGALAAVELWYRHVNQAERWRSVAMARSGANYKSAIPADYTNSPFPLQYYFALRQADGSASLFPAFNATLSNQPYYAIWRRQA